MRFRHSSSILRLIFCLPILLSCSCAVPKIEPCIKDGKDYSKIRYITTHNDWDSCYLRGRSYMDGGCLDLAIKEFAKSIHDRSDDERLARAYGMHFMGYFPHRELGIIYYHTGRTQEAMKELEKSIQDSPSSKAMYFLNEVRRQWLQENDLDLFPPRLHLSFPSSDHYLTNALKLTIKGQAEDDNFVSSLSIDGEPIFIELSAQTIPFIHTLFLKRGKNSITIMTEDLLGRRAEKTLDIVVDRTCPIVNLSHTPLEQAIHDGRMLIQGIILDDLGVNTLIINDKSIALSKGKMVEFSQWIELAEDVQRLPLLATDMAGNKTSGHIELSPDSRNKTALSLYHEDRSFTRACAESSGQDLIKIASLDIPRFALNDTEPFLFFEPLPSVTIYDSIYLLGKIQYQTDISDIKIFINNHLISSITYDSGLLGKLKRKFTQEGEKVLFLGETIEIAPGQNEITIEVTNEKGTTKRKSFYVVKKEEDLLDQKYRLCVSILPVEDLSEPEWNSDTTKRYVFFRLNTAFVNQKRFQVVEREKLEEILREQRISVSDLSRKKNVIRVGNLSNAEAIFTGYMRNREDSIELSGTMIDTQTTKLLYSSDVYLKGDKDEIIPKAAEILAMKIRNHFPLCKGKILEKRGAKIKVNIGRQQNICEHTKLIIYREEEWESLLLSEAKVERVFDDYSSAL
ncbi:MAG: CsgG/HfaB family protein, partial [bacterium]